MKLISATPSPFARQVRIALIEKALPFELITDISRNADTRVPQMDPLGKVPVLIPDDGGSAIFDSRFILEYLELKFPTLALVPADIDRRLAAKRLEVLADGVCDAVVRIVLERIRAPKQQSTAWIERRRGKIDAGVKAVAESVSGKPWTLGRHFGLGDIAVGSMLGYLDLRFPETPWRSRYPALVDLTGRLAERTSFKATVPAAQRIDTGAA